MHEPVWRPRWTPPSRVLRLPPELHTVKHSPSFLVARRHLRVLPALVAVGFVAACGGGDGPTTPSGTSVRLDVTAQTTLATGTTGALVRVTPSYERASGERVPLAPQTQTLGSGASQSFSMTFDLAPCLNDPARRGAEEGTGANAVCTIAAAVSLQSGDRVLDEANVGPYRVRGGSTTAVSVSFVEVASVTVGRANGTDVGPQPIQLLPGQTLALAGRPVGPSGAALDRPIAWTSNATNIATVDQSGVVTPVGIGTVRITGTVGGRTASVDVVVQPTLTVTLTGTGIGSVRSETAGSATTCTGGGTVCTVPYAPNATVTLTPTPDANSTFEGWGGACSGTGACTVALTEVRAVSANFGRRRVALTVNIGAGGGTGAVTVTGGNVNPAAACTQANGSTPASCAYTVDAGTTVNVTAAPAAGSRRSAWTGDCAAATGATCALVPTAAAVAGIRFEPAPAPDTLSVEAVASSAGEFGGTLAVTGIFNGQPTPPQFAFSLNTASPSPARGLALDAGSQFTLRFAPNAQSRVVSWGGACAGQPVSPTGESTCTATLNGSTQATITLAPR
jgi:hypothetical protein